jgi:uncharacterized protein with NRDE domain
MCLLVFAWMKHPRYRLVVAANRDEFHDRPAAPLGWWTGNDRMLAGRDLRAGGTWLGVTRNGRFAAVTNFRGAEAPPVADAPTRGGLVPDYLAGEAAPGGFLEKLNGAATAFAGFNLLAGDRESLHYLSNRDTASPRRLAPGTYGLSNHALDTPWPRLVRARERFEEALAGDQPGVGELFELLADREPATDAVLHGSGLLPPGLERAMSAPFVLHEGYGTRCSTVLLAGHDGRTVAAERRFDAAGNLTGATRLEFAVDPPGA